jgi:hypothetical protein
LTAREERLRELRRAEAEFESRARRRPRELSAEEQASIRRLGDDIERVWSAPTTTDRDRKELLRALLEEVMATTLTMRWRAARSPSYASGPREPASDGSSAAMSSANRDLAPIAAPITRAAARSGP